MPALLIVAQRVKIWIEPLLYAVLYVGAKSQRGQLWIPLKTIRHLLESRPPPQVFRHVRHLCFVNSDATEHHQRDGIQRKVRNDLQRLLTACDATIDLHLVNLSFTPALPSVLLLLEKLSLHRLSVDPTVLFHNGFQDYSLPLFSKITHLNLHNAACFRNAADCPDLSQMPCLTHLSFVVRSTLPYAWFDALQRCKSLKVLALLWSDRQFGPMFPSTLTFFFSEHINDPRVVMFQPTNPHEDWEIGARGGEDFWARADEVVRKRRAGEPKEYIYGLD
ncbi:hypothetical protein C8R44DRAFT_891749 [Mycena epipterygia]|nr:hypothetical protein C8R44DRAFT_891749 [Mycena epipterygia]